MVPSLSKDTRDLRDPQKLGEALLKQRGPIVKAMIPASMTYDAFDFSHIEPYSANPTTLEKYGRPQDLPTTPW